MGKYSEIIDFIKNSESMTEKVRTSAYFLNVIEKVKDDLYGQDIREINAFAFAELEKIIPFIDSAKSYREKNEIFRYEDTVLGIITVLIPFSSEPEKEALELIKTVVSRVGEETKYEKAISDLFEKEKIEIAETEELLAMAKSIEDDYQRSFLYRGIAEFKGGVSKLTDEAWKAFSDYIAKDFAALVSKTPLDEDIVDGLEVAADACKYFMSSDVYNVLLKATELGLDNVNLYALDTFLKTEKDFPQTLVDSLAKSNVCACLAYESLVEAGKQRLFPEEYSNEEYIRKSDMIRWLVYPTELGKEPELIESLGKVTSKKEDYYIFIFKSDSENLTDELKNQWLIGWSSGEGGTFSDFDLYENFKKKTPEKTLKYIKKKLIG